MKGWVVGSQRVLATVLTCAAIVVCRAEITVPQAALKKVNFDIPEQPVESALTALGQQSGLTIIVASQVSGGVQAPGVSGSYTADEALRQLLSPVGLRAEYVGGKTVAIRTAQNEAKGDAPLASAQVAGKKLHYADAAADVDENSNAPRATDSNATSDSSEHAETSKPAERKGIPEILIKGSRVTNLDVVRTEDDVQPYTILTSKQIQESGAVNVEDFLKKRLTMDTTVRTNSQSFASGGGATSSISLRGLGSNETLILINGRRSAGVNPFGNLTGGLNQADINGIPLSAIERIEVLPSSASAIYGGAALGGVINIVLKKSFNGGAVSYSYDNPTSGSAPLRTWDGSYGLSLREDRTQLMLAGSYTDGNPLLLQDRTILVGRGISAFLRNYPAGLYSAVQPFFGATTNIAGAGNANLILKNGTPLNSAITYIPLGTSPGNSNLSSALLANAGMYNFNLAPGTGYSALQSPFGTVPATKALFATIRQALFADVQAFAEMSLRSDSGRTLTDPFSQSFSVPSAATTNPFRQSVLVTFPSEIAAPIITDNVTRSATIGIIAPFAHGWSAEFDYTWSENTFDLHSTTTDSVALRSALSSGVLNPFVDTIANPPNLSPYLVPTTYSGATTLNDLNFRVSGQVGALPAGSPTLTIGLEHRKEGSEDANDEEDFPITSSSSFLQRIFGMSQSTASAYAEALIPVVSSAQSIPLVSSIDLQIAGRSEHYTVHSGTPYVYVFPASAREPPQGVHTTVTYTSTNPTLGVKYEPIPAVALRASYAKGFLPPTPAQLLVDPTQRCGAAPCSSIVDGKTGKTYLVNFSGGGNPDLQPQRSDSWDAGAIWEPHAEVIRGLRVDLEYYRISQPNYIVTPTVQQVVNDSALSDRVTRDPITGLITTVNTSYLNATEYRTSGFDLSVDYSRATAFGLFGLHAGGTWIKYDLRQLQIDSPLRDYAGFPSEGGEAKGRANAVLSWNYHGWTADWTATYYSRYKQFGAQGGPFYSQYGAISPYLIAQGSPAIPSQVYHDLYVSYTFGRSGGRDFMSKLSGDLTISFGLKNIFNTLPPLDAYFGPYYYSNYGDPRLREWRLSVKKAF